MFTPTEVFSIIFLFGAIVVNAISLIIVCHLPEKALHKKILLGLISVFLIHSLYAIVTRFIWKEQLFIGYGAPFELLYGPGIWYISSVLRYKKIPFRQFGGHFIPFFVFMILYLGELLNIREQAYLINYMEGLLGVIVIQWAIYLRLAFLNYKALQKHEDTSTVLKKQFLGFLFLIFGLSGLLFFSFFINSNAWHKGSIANFYLIHLLMFGMACIFNWSIGDYRQKIILKQMRNSVWAAPAHSSDSSVHSGEKYSNNQCDEKLFLKIERELYNLPLSFYSDFDLNLNKLAEQLGVLPFILSQTLSMKMHTSFHDFVNDQRLKIAIRQLQQKEGQTIAEISFQSGFNSEASFYRVFKKKYQCSPRAYQKDNLL